MKILSNKKYYDLILKSCRGMFGAVTDDMLLRENALLNEENKQLKEVIDKIMNLIKQYGKYDGKKCTRGFQMWSADFNKILDILKEVSE